MRELCMDGSVVHFVRLYLGRHVQSSYDVMLPTYNHG